MGLAPSLIINLPGYPFENFPSLASLALLRQVPSASASVEDNYVIDGDTVAGDGGGGVYAWAPFSTEPDDGSVVIKPNDLSPGQAGRWVRTAGRATQEIEGDISDLTADLALTDAKLNQYIRTARDSGAAIDGTTDARAALAVADGLGPFHLTPGLYLVASNLTITNRVVVDPGARLVIPSGVTVTFVGGVDAGDYQIFNIAGTGGVAGLRLSKMIWFAGDMLNTATDALAPLQKSADACVENGSVEHPVGYFTITGATAIIFSKGQNYYGHGPFSSEIRYTTTTSNVWAFSGTICGRIEGVSTVCLNAAPPVAGDALKITAQYVTWENVFIRSSFRGISLDGAVGAKGSNFNVYDAMSVGLLLNNLNDAFVTQFLISSPLDTLNTTVSSGTFVAGETVTGGTSGATAIVSQILSNSALKVSVNAKNFTPGEVLTGGTSAATATLTTQITPHALGGIRLTNKVEAFIASDGDVIGGTFSMTTDAVLNTPFNRPAYNKFSNVYFDSADNGAVIDKAVEFDFDSCWFSNRPGNGITLLTTDGMRFTGGGAINCHQNGALMQPAAKRTVFSNFAARGNSQMTANAFDGLRFAAGVTDFVVSGCTLGSSLGFGTQGYGIQISAGASDRYSIKNNLIAGNGTGGVLDGGTGVNKAVGENY